MEETPPRRLWRSLLVIFLSFQNALVFTSAAMINAPAKSNSFTPSDNYLLDCGNSSSTTLFANRVFLGDQESSKFLAYNGRNIQVAAAQPDPTVPSPIYNSANIFETEATYTFHVSRPGWHWIRLHFSPIQNSEKDLKTAKFQVKTDNLVLIQQFANSKNASWSMREFIVNCTNERFSVTFVPIQGSVAFINAIEFVSAPDMLLSDVATAVFPKGDYSGLSSIAYQTLFRLNAGGPVITAQNDTLGRNWDSDQPYLDPKFMGSTVSVQPNVITYPEGESPLIAPPLVYSTATQMADANVQVSCTPTVW